MGNCSCGRSNRPSKKDSTILTEEEIRFLLNNTKLNREQINSLHYSFLEECQNGKMYKRDFLKLFKKAHPSENRREKPDKFCDYVFRVIDAENRGYITFKDFLLCLNLTSFGDFKQKCEFAFKLYDLDKDNKISKKEMTQVLEALYDMSGIVDRKGEKSPAKKVEDVMNKLNGNLNSNDSPRKKRDYITRDQFIDACCNDLAIKNLLIDSIFANTSYEDDRAHSKDSLVGGKSKLCFLCAFKSMQTPEEHELREKNFKTNASPQKVHNINLTEFQPVIQDKPLVIDSKSVSNYSYQETLNLKNPITQYSQDPVIIEANQGSSNLKLDEKDVYQIVDKYTPHNSTSYHLLDSSNVIPIEITIRRGNPALVENRSSSSQNYVQSRAYVEPTDSFIIRDPIISTRTSETTNFLPNSHVYVSAPSENLQNYEPHFQANLVVPDVYYSEQTQKLESKPTTLPRLDENELFRFVNKYTEGGAVTYVNPDGTLEEETHHNIQITLPNAADLTASARYFEPVSGELKSTNLLPIDKLPKLDERELFRFVDKCTEGSKITYMSPDGGFEEETTHNIEITSPNNTAADYAINEKDNNKLEVELIDGFIQDSRLDKNNVKIESVTKEIASTRYFEPVNGDQVNIENVITDIVFDVNLAEKDSNVERVVTQIPVEIEKADQDEENENVEIKLYTNPDGEVKVDPEPVIILKKQSDLLVSSETVESVHKEETANQEDDSSLIPMTRMASELHKELKEDTKLEAQISEVSADPIVEVKNEEKSLNNNEPNETTEDKVTQISNELEATSSSKDDEKNSVEPTTVQVSETSPQEIKTEIKNEQPEEPNQPIVAAAAVAENDTTEIANIITEIVTNVSDESNTEIVVETKANETIVEISSNSDFEMEIKTTDDNGNNIITTIKAEQISNEENQSSFPKAEAETEKEVKTLLIQSPDNVDEAKEEQTITTVIEGDLDKAPVSLNIQTDPNVSIEEVTVEIEKKESKDDTNEKISNLEVVNSSEPKAEETKTEINKEVVALVNEIVDLSIQNKEPEVVLVEEKEKEPVKTESTAESAPNPSSTDKPEATS